MPPRVLVIGEINVDLILRGAHAAPQPGIEVLADEALLTLGSSSAVFASGLARLGTEVRFVGLVGGDRFGDFCVDAMRDAGVDVAFVTRDPHLQTGVTVSISSGRDRALVTFPGAIEALGVEHVADDCWSGCTHLHISSFFLQKRLRPAIPDLLARATRRRLTTSLDTGFDPDDGWGEDVGEALLHTDLFFPNEVELARLTGVEDPAAALRALGNGRTRTVAKLGAAGAMTIEGARVVHVPAFPVDAADTTGAGDSFNAGYVHAFLRGLALDDCLRMGAACGALSTRGLGGTTTQPRADEAGALAGTRR